MAYTVIPKENPARNNKHQNITLERRTDNIPIGPELSDTVEWHPKTKEWWHTWRMAPIAPLLEDTDWEELELAALAHHKIWTTINRISIAQMTTGLAEIRQRVAKFGATYEDRLKLRIKLSDATIKEDKANPVVAKRVDYKDLVEG